MTRGMSVLCDVRVPRYVDQEELMVNAPEWWRSTPRSRIALYYGRHHDRDAGVPDRGPEFRRCVSAAYEWHAKRLAIRRARA